jgi:L-galactose dehydrogenase
VDYTVLGGTGLRVSVMGLGCGGRSRLGQRHGRTEQESIAIVRRALDCGVTVLDTAESYGTEDILGKALRGVSREQVVISTKKTSAEAGGPVPPAALAPSLEQSLRRLALDYVDLYHLHGLAARHYDYALENLVPELFRLREQGKIRFLGVTEAFASDPGHRMLQRAVRDDCWDVVMVGFNILNQSARGRVFPATRAKGIGTLIMFALRRALSDPARLRQTLADLRARRLVDLAALAEDESLDFLVHDGGASSLQDAAYRFCRSEPGVDVVLSGTGSLEHLERNAASLSAPPLPEDDVARLRRIFAGVDQISGG